MYRPNFTADEVLFPNCILKAVGLAGMSEISLQAKGDVLPIREAGGGARWRGSAPAVAILLCTLNGERFPAEQLASLENWKLIPSDDRSSYPTKSILLAFQKSFDPRKAEI